MVVRPGDDALGPEALGAQLFNADAGRRRAAPDPVVSGSGDDDPNPARAARRAAGDLPAHVRHGYPPCVFTHKHHLSLQMWISFPKTDPSVVICVL